MQPTPGRPPAIEEADLDEVIERIDEALPKIHKLCRLHRDSQQATPAGGLSTEKFHNTRKRLKKLSDDPLLTDNGTDIRSDSDEAVEEDEGSD